MVTQVKRLFVDLVTSTAAISLPVFALKEETLFMDNKTLLQKYVRVIPQRQQWAEVKDILTKESNCKTVIAVKDQRSQWI